MDYFAHGFWSYILYYSKKDVKWAVFWGLFPDTISWWPFAFYRFFSGIFQLNFDFGKPDPGLIPDWTYALYNVSHSLIVFAAILIVVYFLMKKIPVALFAWPLHIFFDIPTHSADYLPTPFLWPFIEVRFPGISWGSAWFMIINYSLIIGLIFFLNRRRKKV